MPPRPPSLLLQVVHLYLAVVDAGERPVELHERSRAISLAQQWAQEEDEVREKPYLAPLFIDPLS